MLTDKRPISAHFVGIGGCGMSAIARIMMQMGHQVSGSDLKESLYTLRLKDQGASLYYSHEASHVRGKDVLVVSSAIKPENAEWQAADAAQIPVLKRAEMLDKVMQSFNRKVAVTGTHGKTTTSALITTMLHVANCAPSFIIGSDLENFHVNANLAEHQYMIVESDESDGSFLDINPNVAVITNMESDHLDHYGTYQNMVSHFQQFIDGLLARNGLLIYNRDDEALHALVATKLPSPQIRSFGLSEAADYQAKHLEHSDHGVSFDLFKKDGQGPNLLEKGRVSLSLFGTHNVYNALSALALGDHELLTMESMTKGLGQFSGTKRRFQKIGEEKGIGVYDDYAHHPTEIQTTLSGIKAGLNRRLIVIFQPHRYTRTKALFEEFAQSFDLADRVYLTDIFAAGEAPIAGSSSEALASAVAARGTVVDYVAKKSDLPSAVLADAQKGDVLVTMGAGDIYTIGKELIARLKEVV